MWSASLGSCGFSHKGRKAGPASCLLLRQTQAGAPAHPGKWPCPAGKSPFDHLISQHVSQGWNLSRLGQQDTPSLPFGPVQPECSQSCLRNASSHFCLCQLSLKPLVTHQPLLPQNSHLSPTTGLRLGLLTHVLTGKGLLAHRQNGWGSPGMVLVLMKRLPREIWLYYF